MLNLCRIFLLVEELPAVLDPEWLQSAFPTKASCHDIPARLAQYRSFSNRLSYRGTPLALEEGEEEAHFSIPNNGFGYPLDFEVVPRDDLPQDHPYRTSYDPNDPVVQWGSFLFPTFWALIMWCILLRWCVQDGVEQTRVASRDVGEDDPGYRALLTQPVPGCTVVDYRIT